MVDAEGADRAMDALHNRIFMGVTLTLNKALEARLMPPPPNRYINPRENVRPQTSSPPARILPSHEDPSAPEERSRQDVPASPLAVVKSSENMKLDPGTSSSAEPQSDLQPMRASRNKRNTATQAHRSSSVESASNSRPRKQSTHTIYPSESASQGNGESASKPTTDTQSTNTNDLSSSASQGSARSASKSTTRTQSEDTYYPSSSASQGSGSFQQASNDHESSPLREQSPPRMGTLRRCWGALKETVDALGAAWDATEDDHVNKPTDLSSRDDSDTSLSAESPHTDIPETPVSRPKLSIDTSRPSYYKTIHSTSSPVSSRRKRKPKTSNSLPTSSPSRLQSKLDIDHSYSTEEDGNDPHSRLREKVLYQGPRHVYNDEIFVFPCRDSAQASKELPNDSKARPAGGRRSTPVQAPTEPPFQAPAQVPIWARHGRIHVENYGDPPVGTRPPYPVFTYQHKTCIR